jgi:hypothetical protein
LIESLAYHSVRSIDRTGTPVIVDDIESIDELHAAVIDGVFDRQWVVDIYRSGPTCRTCTGGSTCRHADRVESALEECGLLAK